MNTSNSTLLPYIKKYFAYILLGVAFLILALGMSRIAPSIFQLHEEVDVLSTEISQQEQALASLVAYGGSKAGDLEIVNTALPSEKNASLIYGKISQAAATYAVTIDSFSVDVGEVYVSDAEGGRDEAVSQLSVTLNITSPSVANTQQFVKELYRSLPLSEITSLKLSDGKGEVTLSFFYKGEPDIASGSASITPLTAREQAVFQEISTWSRP